ncbi:imidazole glycerol phosphate synthase subunit HisH [Candidatus Falkowbacteria bacterium]|nr:imidazole glycerol phosphate synthase subunit HisH [Candidatus Falkowbacteria bacterium]
MIINKPKIVIIDYGVGNLYSLIRVFKFFGIEAIIAEEADGLERADGIILPGVGSFKAGMRGLKTRGLIEKIKDIARSDKPILGICLGAQIMLTEGHEFGNFKGLDIIKGKVVHFPVLADKEKVPHVGWNTVSPLKDNAWPGTIFNSFNEADQVYFVHSYVLEPEDKEDILALTAYGGQTFCSAVKKGNIYGCQFHPEKSGPAGLKIIENFINLIEYGKN